MENLHFIGLLRNIIANIF